MEHFQESEHFCEELLEEELEEEREAAYGLEEMPTPHFDHYAAMKDAEVAALANAGDGQALEYLLNKYKNFVLSKARTRQTSQGR